MRYENNSSNKEKGANMQEVDIICDGIAILILSVIGISIKKLDESQNWLNSFPRKSKRAVMLYIIGLLVCETKSTNTKIASKVGYVSHDTLRRSLEQGKRVIGKVPLLLINYCMSLNTAGYLVIDDVLIPKRYSREIQGVYNEYDHVDNERMKGMRVVMILWHNGKIRIPVAWAIWHKEKKTSIVCEETGKVQYQNTGECLLKINGQVVEYKTKNQIAMDLLDNLLSRGLKAEFLTFDNWYTSRENLQAFRDNRYSFPLHCYSRLKSNRIVIYNGEKVAVRDLIPRFETSAFNHKHGAYIKALEVLLPGFDHVKLLLVKNDSHLESEKTKFLFSTDLSDSAPMILLRYRKRWAIETAFRDLKQNFNIGSCQACSLDTQKNHLALSVLAFVLLEILPDLTFDQNHAHSIGEKKALLSRLSLFTNPKRTKFWALDTSRPNRNLIDLTFSKLYEVGLLFDFAFDILYISHFQRTA